MSVCIPGVEVYSVITWKSRMWFFAWSLLLGEPKLLERSPISLLEILKMHLLIASKLLFNRQIEFSLSYWTSPRLACHEQLRSAMFTSRGDFNERSSSMPLLSYGRFSCNGSLVRELNPAAGFS